MMPHPCDSASQPPCSPMRHTIARMAESIGLGTRMQDVADAGWRAATDASTPMYLPAGADALQWAAEAS